ncbi:MAG: hypothetical protein K6E51_13270 [Treponema sp.]|nr:hypothetical protein [Treponema sp.]
MKKLYLILGFSFLVAFTSLAQSLSYESFVSKYKEAANLYSQKQYESALQILDILISDKYAQTYPSVFLSRALTLHSVGRYAESKIDIDKCISFQPYALKPLLCRSIICLSLKEYDLALTDINYCLEKNPSWADAYHQRGLIYLSLANYPKALQDFEDAILNANGSYKPEYFSDRGFAHYYLQDIEKAKADFTYSLTMAENDNVYLCLIDVCYKLQEYDEGIKYADILINQGRRVESAIIERVYIYLIQERYDEVKRDLDSIEQACKDISSYHKVKGIYFILTGNNNLGDEEIQKASILNPDDKDIILLKAIKNRPMTSNELRKVSIGDFM